MPLRGASILATREYDTIFANFDDIVHLHTDFMEVRPRGSGCTRPPASWGLLT